MVCGWLESPLICHLLQIILGLLLHWTYSDLLPGGVGETEAWEQAPGPRFNLITCLTASDFSAWSGHRKLNFSSRFWIVFNYFLGPRSRINAAIIILVSWRSDLTMNTTMGRQCHITFSKITNWPLLVTRHIFINWPLIGWDLEINHVTWIMVSDSDWRLSLYPKDQPPSAPPHQVWDLPRGQRRGTDGRGRDSLSPCFWMSL